MGPQDSLSLLNRWYAGDEQAASALHERYIARLTGLVRLHLARKFSRRLDADDVAQSAYCSLFVGLREGRFLVQRSGDLWSLLVVLARNKLYRQMIHHSAQKRNISREAGFDVHQTLCPSDCRSVDSNQAVDEAIAVGDEIEFLCEKLSLSERRIFELRLGGYSLDEIAADVACSQRTVRRVMERIRSELSMQLSGSEPQGQDQQG